MNIVNVLYIGFRLRYHLIEKHEKPGKEYSMQTYLIFVTRINFDAVWITH